MYTPRAISYVARSTIDYADGPPPAPPQSDEVVISPRYTGICGTDILVWHDGHSRAAPPVILGHEFSGEVIEVGEGVRDIRAGDLVTVEPLLPCGRCERCEAGAYNQCGSLRLLGVDVDGSLAPRVHAPASQVLVLPEGVDALAGAFVEPTAVVCHLLRRMGPLRAGGAVFIAGGGPIGLIAAEILLSRGHAVLIGESNEYRARVAEMLGAQVASSFAEAEDRARDQGIPVVGCIDATGAPGALAACIRIAAPGASVGVVGLSSEEPVVDVTAVISKELDLHGSRVYTRVDFEEAISVIASGTLSLDRLTSRIVPFERGIADGFEAIAHRAPVVKILIEQTSGLR